MSFSLSQEESESLLKMDKVATNDNIVDFPDFGGKLQVDLINEEMKEEFIINFTRSSINLEKRNHLLRGHKVIVLARLDLDGPPHRNPDGEEIPPRHLHLYKEGYGDKWAYPIPSNIFTDLDDAYQTLQDFMKFCSVSKPPNIEKSLFS